MARTYTREFKASVCKLIVEEGLKIGIVAERFGLHPIMVYRWVDKYREEGAEAFDLLLV